MKNTKLKTIREQMNLTQVQVAKGANITEACYQRYEAGVRIPRADIAIKIAETVGVKSYKTFKELFGQGERR